MPSAVHAVKRVASSAMARKRARPRAPRKPKTESRKRKPSLPGLPKKDNHLLKFETKAPGPTNCTCAHMMPMWRPRLRNLLSYNPDPFLFRKNLSPRGSPLWRTVSKGRSPWEYKCNSGMYYSKWRWGKGTDAPASGPPLDTALQLSDAHAANMAQRAAAVQPPTFTDT